jgi:hypothetical protein
MEKWQMQKMSLIEQAIALLRQDKLRGFRIDIETDSTINDNAREEKTERVEFITAMSGFIEKSMQAAQMYPEIVPLLGKSILFAVRGFRVGRDLESSIEEFIDKTQIDVKKAQGQPKPPSPEQIKAQADVAMAQASIQEAQLKSQGDQARSQAEIQSRQIDAQANQQEMQMKQQLMQLDYQIKVLEAQIKAQDMQQKIAYDAAFHDSKMKQLQFEHNSKMMDHAAKSRLTDQETAAGISKARVDAANRHHEATISAHAREHEARVGAHTREHEAQVQAAATAHQAGLKAHDAQLKMRDKHPNKKLPSMPEMPDQPEMPESPLTQNNSGSLGDELPPIPGARKHPKDGNWYLEHPPGKWHRVDKIDKDKEKLDQENRIKEEVEKNKHEKIANLMQMMYELNNQINKPKKIVRQNGLITGIE